MREIKKQIEELSLEVTRRPRRRLGNKLFSQVRHHSEKGVPGQVADYGTQKEDSEQRSRSR